MYGSHYDDLETASQRIEVENAYDDQFEAGS